jgi:ABC-type phosphate/phosphonate transport system substrate-binding protein
MIATLPMYGWPETRTADLVFWDAIRAQVPGLPDLSFPDWAGVPDHWRDPALVFSQTCWGPLRLGLLDHLRVLAQPDYSAVPGGRGMFYRSAVVARDGAPRAVPGAPAADLPPMTGIFARNSADSLSGWLGLVQDNGRPPARIIDTGSHRASIRAVAEGRADMATIDCRSWAMALEHEPCARALVVVGWTAERPGLPFVTSRATPEPMAQALRAALVKTGCHAPQGENA